MAFALFSSFCLSLWGGFLFFEQGGGLIFALNGVVLGFLAHYFLKSKKSGKTVALEAIQEMSPEGVMLFDVQGKLAFANKASCDFFQFFPSHVDQIQLVFFDAFIQSQESKDSLARLKMYTLHQQEGNELVDWLIQDKVKRFHICVKPLPTGGGVAWFIQPSASQEDAFFSEGSIFSDILNSYPSPAFVASLEGKILYANATFYEWLGYTPEEILGKNFYDCLVEEPESSWQEGDHAVLLFKSVQNQQEEATVLRAVPLQEHDAVCVLLATSDQVIALRKEADDAALLEGFPMPALILDQAGYIKSTNRAFQDLVQERRVHQRPLSHWVAEEERSALAKFFQAVRYNRELKQPLLFSFKGIESRILGIYARYLVMVDDPKTSYFIIFLHDLTELKKMETQSLESQKLQALGQLASGITHDFNNLLTAMLGFCDLLLQRHTPQDQSFTDIMQIKQNANRATNLVRQLLLFAKQTAPDPKPLDVRECLNELSFLLRRLIGSKVELTLKHERDVGFIFADQGQLEQIIVNLVINARDAMVLGGKLTIRTRMVQLKEPLQLYKETIQPKIYVVVDVVDTGCGISEECLEQIFDPFFSTKDPSQGTGLGLSNVHQIVKQLSGGIVVESSLEKGTTFSIYIPKFLEKKKKAAERKEEEKEIVKTPKAIDLTGSAHVLLVEDEDPVRLFASRALKSKGYQVFEARDGKHALEILENQYPIHLLITDVVMPGMDGPSLVNQAYEFKPDIKVIFVSGYPQEDVEAQIKCPIKDLHFLPKPFSLNELALKVHEVLHKEDFIPNKQRLAKNG
ncbi:MAG: hybrid sensor histidine kinase/response regulator [Alphaproteobacteria bacterium]